MIKIFSLLSVGFVSLSVSLSVAVPSPRESSADSVTGYYFNLTSYDFSPSGVEYYKFCYDYEDVGHFENRVWDNSNHYGGSYYRETPFFPNFNTSNWFFPIGIGLDEGVGILYFDSAPSSGSLYTDVVNLTSHCIPFAFFFDYTDFSFTLYGSCALNGYQNFYTRFDGDGAGDSFTLSSSYTLNTSFSGGYSYTTFTLDSTAFDSMTSTGYWESCPIQISWLANYFLNVASSIGNVYNEGLGDSEETYQQGYEDGLGDTENAQQNAYNNGLADGRQQGHDVGYTEGYNAGVNSLHASAGFVTNLILAVADIPATILNGLATFSLWDISIIGILISIMFVLLILWVVKKVI